MNAQDSTMVTAAEDGGGSGCMASLAKPGEQITGIVVEQIVPAMETPALTSASKALAARRCQELGNDLAHSQRDRVQQR